MNHNKPVFRKDINGLRAAAVIAVIVFHFNSQWLPGGFVGVDVFFVISGYLMTSIIFSGIGNNNFSIVQFYSARARRIIPALSVLCLVVVGFGYFFVIPGDYELLAKHAGHSLLFISNFTYFFEVGYFDVSSHNKWLLHTWSLANEWQFYLVYPVLITGAYKLAGRVFAKYLVVVLAVISFVVCAYTSSRWPDSAFYLLPARAWEMLAGGIAFLWPMKARASTKTCLALTGWAAIIGSFWLIKADYVWPGYLALIPVLGTFAVIQSNSIGWISSRNRLVQEIGKYSYSLYLWHWPIIVGVAYVQIQQNILVMLGFLIFFSILSYHLFEKRRIGAPLTLTSSTVVFLVSLMIYLSYGLPSRVSDEYKLTQEDYHKQFYGGAGYSANKVLDIGDPLAPVSFFMVGDSFGLQYATYLDNFGKKAGLKAKVLFDHGCIILPSYTRYLRGVEDKTCSEEYGKLKSMLAEDESVPLIMVYSWSSYEKNLGMRDVNEKVSFEDASKYMNAIYEELDEIIQDGGQYRDYLLVGAPQSAKSNAFRCLAQAELLGAKLISRCEEFQSRDFLTHNEALYEFSQLRENVNFFDPNEALCSAETCLVIDSRKPIHSDKSHLSIYGAEKVAPLILKSAGL